MTYEELCSFEVLYKAYLEARKGKRSKSKTIEYEAQALACTEKLSRKLAVCNVRQPDGSIRQQIRYVPSKFEVFAVYIDMAGLKNLEYLYRSYHALGGNGTGTELFNRAKALPIHDN